MRTFNFMRGFARAIYNVTTDLAPGWLTAESIRLLACAAVLLAIAMFASVWWAISVAVSCLAGFAVYLFAVKMIGDKNIARLDQASRRRKAAR